MHAQATLLATAMLLGGCHRTAPPPAPADIQNSNAVAPALPPAVSRSAAPAPAVAATVPDAFVALGTEPFWSATVAAGRLTYATPEYPEGRTVPVTRDASPQGARFAGQLGGKPLVLTIARGVCSDGMSDRSYAFTASLSVDAGERRGCAHLPDAKEEVR